MSGRAVAVAVALACLAALPLVASALRTAPAAVCARDGVEIGDLLEVRVRPASGAELRFCSVRCAEDFLARGGAGRDIAITVKDEKTGAWIPAKDATFARSLVVTSRATGERIHAFAKRADAEAHVAAYGGRVLEGGDRPFGGSP